MSDILENLNERQIEAITTLHGPVQIIAGAGSGKTRVITHRIAWLISQGVKPWNILALTFTNRAAKEMRDRISLLTDSDSASKIWAGTFHSIFAKILRVEATYLGYDSNYSIYDSDSAERAIRAVMDSLVIPVSTLKPRNVLSIISSAKNKLLLHEDYANKAYTRLERTISEIYSKYQAYLLKNNAMDFDDILINMLRLLHNTEMLSKYQDRFHYILIDEYQDTNKVQYFAVKELAKHRQNICVVGDDAQSIYKWRGADIGNILNFSNDYPYCKSIKLEQNYRSTKNILAAADSVILNNKQQLHKVLWTENVEGEQLKLYKFNNERDEADKIISQISKQVQSGYDIKEFVILYRTNAQSLEFEKACRMHNIPYIVVGGFSFFKRSEVNDILAYFRLLVNPKDELSLRRIINEPPRGIGKSSIQKLEDFSNSHNITLFQGLGAVSDSIISGQKTLKSMRKLSLLFKTHTDFLDSNASTEHLVDYIDNTGILDWYKELDTDESKDKLLNIEELLNDVINYLNEDNSNTLDMYLERISLINDLDDTKFGDNVLRLMTIHSSKALEFDNVYIAGMEQGLFPLSMLEDDIEEERRLCYVALTRARKHIFLSYTEYRNKFGKCFTNPPSVFLNEIPPKLLEDVYNNSFLKKKVSYKGTFNLPSTDSDSTETSSNHKLEHKTHIHKPKFPTKSISNTFDDLQYEDDYSQIPKPQYSNLHRDNFKTGDTIKHKQFGIGTIINISGSGDNQKVVVNFDTVGRKQLLLKFANLEIVDK